jgi:hypothetical protein
LALNLLIWQSRCTLQEFLTKLDQYKPMVLSLNLTGRGLERQSASAGVSGESLAQLNQRYDRLCARAAVWYKELQIAFLSSSDTNQTADNLVAWLRDVTARVTAIEPITTRAPRNDLMAKYTKLQVERVQVCNNFNENSFVLSAK